jgi:hypothetical protein
LAIVTSLARDVFLQEERVKKVEEEQEKCTFERENMLKIV